MERGRSRQRERKKERRYHIRTHIIDTDTQSQIARSLRAIMEFSGRGLLSERRATKVICIMVGKEIYKEIILGP